MQSRSIAGARVESPSRQRHVLALILLVVLFFSFIDRVNVSILVVDPEFLADMGIAGSALQKGMLMTVFLAAYGIGNVFLSPLGDRVGPRKAMSIAIAIWSVSLLVGGITSTFTAMLASRVILGLSEGVHFPMQSKYVKEWYPLSERGKANSIWQAGISVAPALAMPLFTFIIHTSGWRSSFFILCAAGLIPLTLIWFFTSDTPRQNKRVNELELTHIETGLRKEHEALKNHQTTVQQIKSFAGNYQFWLLTLYYALHNAIFWGMMTWLPTYLKEARGFSWSAMGLLSSLPWIVSLFAKFVGGYLLDRANRRAPFIFWAMVAVTLGVYLGASLENATISAILLAIGIGATGFALPAIWTLLQDLVPSHSIGAGAGMMNGLATGLSALAPLMIGFVVKTTGSYADGLYALVGCSIFAGLIMLCMTLKGK
ncbi:MFS transporter [Burkholderia cepacia]|uniref:Permease n=1 Tax=Burkholderia cepacia GG4 TaxID=1009846 RepID=A0A9W3PBY5_BURCE|nr:MFS transporter [Burkholderia cepacia]AFQ51075.1 putative permease [Burkholderia cepacia GG4]